MLTTTTSLMLGCSFILTAALCVWLILEGTSGATKRDRSERLIAAHRIAGYTFIALFCLMLYYMFGRLGSDAATSGSTTVHMTLALVLAPLIFLKVLLARRYRTRTAVLMPLGMLIFVLAFLVVAVESWPYLVRTRKSVAVSLDQIGLPPVTLDIEAAASLMERKCSKCHNLDRIAGARKDARGWAATVSRMRSLPSSGFSDSDARMIAAYLTSRNVNTDQGSRLAVERAIVDQRCRHCHNLDRVYAKTQSRTAWQETVSRMEEYAAGSAVALRPGEAQQIVEYLSVTQTPEGINQKRMQAKSPPTEVLSIPPQSPENQASSMFNPRAVGLSVFVLAGLSLLALRRPRGRPGGPAGPAIASASPAAINQPAVLKLIGVSTQTPDAKTLRFAVPSGMNLKFRPGQFLNFSFLFDGRKETRCYSICSSSARSGYIEITPKRAKNGCVSVFLNDQASVGLTVEASGPFGEFYFDPDRHKRIVLIAAGSGITPMMAMLRYIKDLYLETPATLLYCVRTIDDVMFRSDLNSLRTELKSFRYHVQLSEPTSEWFSWRGHISPEFVASAVDDFANSDFFLCGPSAFMDLTRSILLKLGASVDRIYQEEFGSSKTQRPEQTDTTNDTAFTVEFSTSCKTALALRHQTLLQVAELNGVSIPYSCRQGQCGTCKTRLLEGSVTMDSEAGLDPESKARGFVLTCVGRPNGKVRLDA